MEISRQEARALAAHYGTTMAEAAANRDRIILACRAADLPISDISRLMGVSRYLIYDVIGKAERRALRNAAIPGAALVEAQQLGARLARESWPRSAGQAPPVLFKPADVNLVDI